MKNMDLQKDTYEAPKCECLEMVNEGVLCASEVKMNGSINAWDDEVMNNGDSGYTVNW